MATETLSYFKCSLLILCVFQFYWEGCRAETNYMTKEKQVLDSLLHYSRYDRRVRPVGVNATGRGPATNVTINVYLSAISNVDDVKMQMTLQMLLRQQWTDQRLTFDDYGGKMRTLVLQDKTKIWRPDIFFPNEIGGLVHSVLEPNSFIRITNSKVFTSNRLSLTIACPMDLKWYPFDSQQCDLQFESYGYASKDLFLSWDETNPVGKGKFKFPRFSLEKFETLITESKTKTGEYHGLKLVLFLKRHLTYSLIRAFTPSVMFVILSWLSFWLDTQAVATRLLVSIGSLFAAAAHSFAFGWSTPAVDYVTSMDVWFGVCLTFVFAALLETVWVNYEVRSRGSKTADGSAEAGEKSPSAKKRSGENGEKGRFAVLQTLKDRLPEGPSKIDFAARVVFPVLFGLFNIFYWAVNLCHYS